MTWKIYLAEKTSTCGSQLENLGFESKQLAFNQQNLVDSTGNNMDRTMIELLHDIKWYIEPRKTAMHTIERFQPDVVFLKKRWIWPTNRWKQAISGRQSWVIQPYQIGQHNQQTWAIYIYSIAKIGFVGR